MIRVEYLQSGNCLLLPFHIRWLFSSMLPGFSVSVYTFYTSEETAFACSTSVCACERGLLDEVMS